MSYRNINNIQSKYNYYNAINNNIYSNSEHLNPIEKNSNSSLNYSKQNYIDKLSPKYNQNSNLFHNDNNINYNDYEEEKNNFIYNDDYNEHDENYDYIKKNYGEQYNFSNKVMNDFKEIMEQTKIIQNKILLKSKDIKNNIFNNSYFCNENTKKFLKSINKKNTNFDNSEEDINDYLIIDSNINNNTKTKNLYNTINEIDSNENIKEKIKMKNKILSDMNSKIILKNNLLELEISNYESKQPNQQQNNNINNNTFYFSLKKFMTNLKISLKNNIESNKILKEKIFAELIENQKMNENNNKNRKIYEKLKLRYQKENERISDIQKYNLENNKRYLNLKDEKNLLNKTYEKLKLNLSNLKYNEKNLNPKRDRAKKNKNDNQELIQALNKNIYKLKNENSTNVFMNTNKNNKLIQNQNSINLFNDKINQLISIYKNLQNEKYLIDEENMNMKNELDKNNGGGLITENNKLIRENELKVEINDIKLNNYNIEKQIQEKDDIIKKMKNLIKQFTSNVNNDETESKDIKRQIAELMQNESKDLKSNINNNRLKENKLDEEINKQINLNINLDKQIKSTMQKYDELINKKDKEILNLESHINTINNKDELNEDEYNNIILDKENINNDYNLEDYEEQEGNEYDYEEYNFQNNEDIDEKEQNFENIKNKNFDEEEIIYDIEKK